MQNPLYLFLKPTLDAGIRHVDTAAEYGTEAAVAEGVADGGSKGYEL